MLIDKRQPFWTELEIEKDLEYKQEYDKIQAEMDNFEILTEEWNALAEKQSQLIEQRRALLELVEERYIVSFEKNPKKVYADIKEIVEATTQEEFLKSIQSRQEYYKQIVKAEYQKDLDNLTPVDQDYFFWTANYDTFQDFIAQRLIVQYKVINRYDLNFQKASDIVDAHITQWYKRTKSQLPITVAHGAIMDNLAKFAGQKPEVDKVGNATFASGAVEVFIKEFNAITKGLSINAHKLLMYSIGEFMETNTYAKNETGRPILGIHSRFSDYAEDRDITDKKKIKQLRNDTRKELNVLAGTSLTWEEKIHGQVQNFDKLNIFGRVYLKGDIIYTEFSQSFANYLMLLPLNQYSRGLLKIDGRNPNAYNIGLAMCTHYNLDNNIYKGTYNRLKVRTLLSDTSLPSYEKIQSQEGSWEQKIKEPFEEKLEDLVKVGVITYWYYAKTGGERLSDEEIISINDYHSWADLLIVYELANATNHTPRLERRAKERRKEEALKGKADKKKK